MFARLFCRHDWDCVSNETFSSMMEYGLSEIHLQKMPSLNHFEQMQKMFSRTNLKIYICPNCGAIKKFKTVI